MKRKARVIVPASMVLIFGFIFTSSAQSQVDNLSEEPLTQEEALPSNQPGFAPEEENTDIDEPDFPLPQLSEHRPSTADEARELLEERTSYVDITLDERTGTPRWIRLRELDMHWAAERPVHRAYQFLHDYGELYGVLYPYEELAFQGKEVDELGFTHVEMRQQVQGVPVVGNELMFHFAPSGELTSVNGSLHQLRNMWEDKTVTEPTLSEEGAVNTIEEHFGVSIVVDEGTDEVFEEDVLKDDAEKDTPQDNLGEGEENIPGLPEELVEAASQNRVEDLELVFYDAGAYDFSEQNVRLAWRARVELGLVESYTVYIDAQDGSIIRQQLLVHNASLQHAAVAPSCSFLNIDMDGEDFSNALSNINFDYNEAGFQGEGEEDEQTVEVIEYANEVYDYFHQVHGRDGYDNQGSAIYQLTYVEQEDTSASSGCSQYNGAFSSYIYNILGYGEDYIAQDVTAHEYTHIIVGNSVGTETETLNATAESNALNEAYSDIFAQFSELYYGDGSDWLIGEDLPEGSLGSRPSIRDFANPNQESFDVGSAFSSEDNYGTASHYYEYVNQGSSRCGGDENDRCEHVNATIITNAMYLAMYDDLNTNPYSGEQVYGGVDEEIATNIYYRALTRYTAIDTTFPDHFDSVLDACLDLNLSDAETYPLSVCDTFFRAYHATGVNNSSSEPFSIIDASVVSGTAPLSVEFSAENAISFGAEIVDYTWSFGDGTTEQPEEPTFFVHEFTDPGTYTVQLRIEDDQGATNDSTVIITVENPVDTTFRYEGASFPIDEEIVFDASASTSSSGTIIQYDWDFGDGNTDSLPDAEGFHTYTTAGHYTVTLTTTDDSGYSNSYSQMIHINDGTGIFPITGTLSNDRWTHDDGVITITGQVTIPEGVTVTVEPNTVVKFTTSTSELIVEGTLNIYGSSGNEAVFTSYKADTRGGDTNGDGGATIEAAGDWRRIAFEPGSTGVIEYAIIECGGYYGNGTDYAMLTLDSANVTISNSEILETEYQGVYAFNSDARIVNNTFTNLNAANGQAMYIYSSAGGALIRNTIDGNYQGIIIAGDSSVAVRRNTIENALNYAMLLSSFGDGMAVWNNTISNNGFDVVYASGSTYGSTTLWDNNGTPYYVTGNITVQEGDQLHLRTGAIFKLISSRAVTVDGELNALGSTANPVVFTSSYDDSYGGDTNRDGSATTPAPGDWRQITFEEGSTANIEHAVIQYGGLDPSSSSSTHYPMIEIESASVSITHSAINHSDYSAISVIGTSAVTIDNNTIEDNAYQGLYINGAITGSIDNNTIDGNHYGLYLRTTDTFSVQQNTFSNNTLYPLTYNLHPNTTLSGNTYSGNTREGIYAQVSANYDMHMPNDGIPYVVTNLRVTDGYTLTVDPGVIMKRYSNYYFQIEDGGTLDMQGTSAAPIIMTSYYDDTYGGDTNGDGSTRTAAANDWLQLELKSGSTATIDYAVIKYGGYYGSGTDYAMIDIESAAASITNSTISNSAYRGIDVTGTSSVSIDGNTIEDNAYQGLYINGAITGSIDNNTIDGNHYGLYLRTTDTFSVQQNTFSNNTGYPLQFNLDANTNLSGNTYSGNQYEGIYTIASYYYDMHMPDDGIPYVVYNLRVRDGYSLTVDPGVIMKRYSNYYFQIEDGSTLDMQGTSTDPIIMTSWYDDTYGGDTNGDGLVSTPTAGNWQQIELHSGSTATIDYAVIKYGGYYGTGTDYAMIDIESATASITNSTIEDSAYYGIGVTGTSAVAIDNNTFSDNTYQAMYINGAIIGSIDNNTIDGNNHGMYLRSTDVLSVQQNIFSNNTGYPLQFNLDANTTLSGNTYSGNQYEGIYTIASYYYDMHMPDDGIPYILYSLRVRDGYTLTVDPGVIMKRRSSSSTYYFQVEDGGTLDMQGTSAAPIIMTSFKDDTYGGDTNADGAASTPVAGDWRQIDLQAGSTATIDYAVIKYGGYDPRYSYQTHYPMIDIESATASITNSTISNSAYHGIDVTGTSSVSIDGNTIEDNAYQGLYINGAIIGSIDNNTIDGNYYGAYLRSIDVLSVQQNTFSNNTGYPLQFNLDANTSLSGNTYSGNQYEGIYTMASYDYDMYMPDDGIPYAVYNVRVRDGYTLTVDPGVIIKRLSNSSNYYFEVQDGGTLDMQGTSAAPIIMTSFKDDTYGGDTNADGAASTPAAGDWRQIDLQAGSTATIDYAVIQYGGYYGSGTDYPMVQIASDNVTISNSTFDDSEYQVIFVSASSPMLSGNTINANSATSHIAIYISGGGATIEGTTVENSGYGVYVSGSATPLIYNSTFTGNTYGIYNRLGNPGVIYNDIYGNSSYGVYNYDSSNTINAQYNYWGDSTGPHHQTTNPGGLGDVVSDYVDYSNYL